MPRYVFLDTRAGECFTCKLRFEQPDEKRFNCSPECRKEFRAAIRYSAKHWYGNSLEHKADVLWWVEHCWEIGIVNDMRAYEEKNGLPDGKPLHRRNFLKIDVTPPKPYS